MKAVLIRLTLSAIALVSSSLAVAQGSVNFFNWGNYINPKTIQQFEQQTGIKVNQSFFDGSNMLRAKLLAGNTGYDIAVPALVDMKIEIPSGAFEPLDKSKLSNYHLLSKALYRKTASIDKGNRYGIIYSWGTTGIAYNVKAIRHYLGPNTPVHSWKLLLDPKYLKKLKGCGVSFLNSPTQVFGIVLHYLGLNPNTNNPQDFIKAAQYLMKLRPYITYFNNWNYINDMASGNLCIAMAYSGDTMRAIMTAKQTHDNIDLQYVIPSDGAPIWFDMFAIPQGAPDYDAALKFINFMISPKIAAENSNFLYQPNATPSSAKYLLPVLKQPNMTPPPQVIKQLFLIQDPSPELAQLVTSLWLQVKYGVRLE